MLHRQRSGNGDRDSATHHCGHQRPTASRSPRDPMNAGRVQLQPPNGGGPATQGCPAVTGIRRSAGPSMAATGDAKVPPPHKAPRPMRAIIRRLMRGRGETHGWAPGLAPNSPRDFRPIAVEGGLWAVNLSRYTEGMSLADEMSAAWRTISSRLGVDAPLDTPPTPPPPASITSTA